MAIEVTSGNSTLIQSQDGVTRQLRYPISGSACASEEIRDIAHGWRIWYTKPDEKPLTLYSPAHGGPKVPQSTSSTRSRIQHATCPDHPHHKPPVAGCRCGIYAVANTVDAIYRTRAMAANIRDPDPFNSWFPYGVNPRMVPVLARVTLRQAREHDDAGTWGILAKVKRQIATSTPVLRAASVEITRVYVPDEVIDAEAADRLAQRLAEGLGVVAVGGGFPSYTPQEWDSRPEWMRTEPWRTMYEVDTTLGSFSRDGYRKAPPTPPLLHVTFVCWGNICRSPMAEKMFARQIQQRGLAGAVRVTSAGTHGRQHAPGQADARTVQVLRKHGYPTAHRATQVGSGHLSADLVIALDGVNARILAGMGVPAERLRLLRSFEPGTGVHVLDVENPYNGTQADFEDMFATIEASLPGLHEWVGKQGNLDHVRVSSTTHALRLRAAQPSHK